jgi:hypothetical protein
VLSAALAAATGVRRMSEQQAEPLRAAGVEFTVAKTSEQ